MKWNDSNIKKNISLFYLYSGFASFDFTRGIFVLFLLSKGLTIVQVGLLQTLLFWSNLIFEVPAGFFADKIKRKYSVAFGLIALSLVGLTSIYSQTFTAFIFIFILNGLGYAFKSGADSALLFDGLKDAGESWLTKHVNILANSRNISTIGLSFAIAFGGYLQKSSWDLVYGLFAVCMLVSAFLMLRISEPKRHSQDSNHGIGELFENKGIVAHLKEFFKNPKGKSLLTFLLGMGLIEAAHTPFFIYIQVLLKSYKLSELNVGCIISAAMVITSLGYFMLPKFPKLHVQKILFLFCIPVCLFMLSFSLELPVYIIVPLFFLINTLPNFMFVFTDHHINEQIPSRIRATFLSVQSFVTSFFISMSYLGGGYLMDRYPPHIVLSLLGFLPILGLIVLHFHFNNGKKLLEVAA
jgi:MFS family permease